MAWSEASSPLYEDVPLGKPALRVWDIDDNSTAYDRQRAAPSDESMHIVWSVWSTFFFVFATFNIVVLLGILSSRKVRKRPFNIYVIFLMIPDIVYTLSCAIQCSILASKNGFLTPGACQAQSFYLMFGLTANSYMNALIASELKRLLTWCNRRARYKPPKGRVIVKQSLLVFLWSTGVSMAGWVVAPWWPHRTDLQNGLVCLPIAFDTLSTVIFWVVFFPIMTGIPLCYCLWVAYDVCRRKLLPPKGKRRELMIYFYKITAVFAIMWVPGVFFFYVSVLFHNVNVTIWAIYISAVWSHSQGAVAAGVSMMKADIYQAVMNFVTFRICCYGEDEDGDVLPRGGSSRIWASSSLLTMGRSNNNNNNSNNLEGNAQISTTLMNSTRSSTNNRFVNFKLPKSTIHTEPSTYEMAGCGDDDDYSQGSIEKSDDDDNLFVAEEEEEEKPHHISTEEDIEADNNNAVEGNDPG